MYMCNNMSVIILVKESPLKNIPITGYSICFDVRLCCINRSLICTAALRSYVSFSIARCFN
jgi:hypothetical protein